MLISAVPNAGSDYRASTPPTTTPTPSSDPEDQIVLSDLTPGEQLVYQTGRGLARLGTWGGAALGVGGMALAGGGPLGMGAGALLGGLYGSEARSATAVLDAGKASVKTAIEENRKFNPAKAGADLLGVVSLVTVFTLADTLIGGWPGAIVGAGLGFGAMVALDRQAEAVESRIRQQAG